MRGHLDVVEAGDRDVLRHAQLLPQAFLQRAVGQDVVAAEHGARPLRQAQQGRHGLARGRHGVGALEHCGVGKANVALGQGTAKAGQAIGGAVVAGADAGDDAETAMADVEQVVGDALRLALVVPADRGPRGRRVVVAGGDEGHAAAEQHRRRFGRVSRADQHQPVDAALEQRPHFGGFLSEVVAAAGEQERVAADVDRLLQSFDDPSEQGAVDRRHDRSHRARALRRERARRAVGHVAGVAQHALGARAQGRSHLVRVVEHARQRGRRDAAARRQSLERARLCRSSGSAFRFGHGRKHRRALNRASTAPGITRGCSSS